MKVTILFENENEPREFCCTSVRGTKGLLSLKKGTTWDCYSTRGIKNFFVDLEENVAVSNDYKYIVEKLISLGGQIGSRKGYIRSHPQKNARFPVWYIQSDDEGNLYRDWTYTPGLFEIWFETKEDCQLVLDNLTDQDKEIIRNLEGLGNWKIT